MAALYVDGPAPTNPTISSAVVYVFWHFDLTVLVHRGCHSQHPQGGWMDCPTYELSRINWVELLPALFAHRWPGVGHMLGCSAQQPTSDGGCCWQFKHLTLLANASQCWDVWQRDNGLVCSLGVSRLFLAGMLWREAYHFCSCPSLSASEAGLKVCHSCGVYLWCCRVD